MKLARVSAILLCGLLMMAATRGTEVTQAQIAQFQTGVATIMDVESKLGLPQRTETLGDGDTAADYILMQESANAASAVPFARLAAGAMNVHEIRVEFEFDTSGHLVGVQTAQRDLVCPHAACPGSELSKPWTPVSTPGD
jgi:hypothetical protein